MNSIERSSAWRSASRSSRTCVIRRADAARGVGLNPRVTGRRGGGLGQHGLHLRPAPVEGTRPGEPEQRHRKAREPVAAARVHAALRRLPAGVALERVQGHVGENQIHLGDRDVGARVGRHPAQFVDVASVERRLGQGQLLERPQPPGRQSVAFRQVGGLPEEGHRLGCRRQAAQHLRRHSHVERVLCLVTTRRRRPRRESAVTCVEPVARPAGATVLPPTALPRTRGARRWCEPAVARAPPRRTAAVPAASPNDERRPERGSVEELLAGLVGSGRPHPDERPRWRAEVRPTPARASPASHEDR